MIDFTVEYKELYDLVKDIPMRRATLIESECRGDDCGSLLLPPFEATPMSLFLLSQKVAPGGFVEKECLSKEDLDSLKEVREKLKDEELKKSLISILEEYINMPYEDYKILSLGLQEHLIDCMKDNKGEELRNIFKEKIGSKKLVLDLNE